MDHGPEAQGTFSMAIFVLLLLPSDVDHFLFSAHSLRAQEVLKGSLDRHSPV
jgi:hypothetical protein